MKFLNIIRSSEWWEYKLSPLLGIGYATLLLFHQNIFDHAGWLLIILLSLIIGAVYVSIINDITDIDEDLASGKKNRMAGLSKKWLFILPAICIAIGLYFIFFVYYPDGLSMLLYTIPWISFSLYSFRPVRLKSRGIFGALADASGSHIFTSLLMVASVCYITGKNVNWFWFFSIGIWACCYGLRGILWHQFTDRDNDLVAGVNTFASQTTPSKFKPYEIAIFIIELCSLSAILILLANLFAIIALILYVFLVYLRYYHFKQEPVMILTTPGKPYQILMLDYWQALFPVSLLIFASISQEKAWIVLLVHLILFHQKLLQITKDFLLFLKQTF